MTEQPDQTNTVSSSANPPVSPGDINTPVKTGPIEIGTRTHPPEEDEINRIPNPADRNGGAFRPVVACNGEKQEVVIVNEVNDETEGQQYQVNRPDWESPRTVTVDQLTVYEEGDI